MKPLSPKAESNVSIFDRLVGLETEYALRFQSDEEGERPSQCRLFSSFLKALEKNTLTVNAKHFKVGRFLANGGAVWFETPGYAPECGLIEGATPECRGPTQVVQYQRAQDALFADAALAAEVPGRLSLLKNDRDANGNTYGAQESYEVEIAEGWRWHVWRLGVCFLLVLSTLTWCILISVGCVVLLSYLLIVGMVTLIAAPLSRRPGKVAQRLLGTSSEIRWIPPRPLGQLLLFCERVIATPLSACTWLLVSFTSFQRVRRQLMPFLVSRAVICGAGTMRNDGRFELSDKAPGLNCVLGFGGFIGERPILSMGHLLKAVYAEAPFSRVALRALFQRKQRLQINLGDSNMAEAAEFLRVGATLLVLDAIEAGEFTDAPRVRKPIQQLRRICRDFSFTEKVRLSDGRASTALDIQRYYLNQCRMFVSRRERESVPQEAIEVLRLWEEMLDGLEHEPMQLFGRVDWVMKRYLLDQATAESFETRKKIDIRYHELTPAGYFRQLEQTGRVERFIDDEMIERAKRTPPSDTPATMRAHYIREFVDDAGGVEANWKCVTVGSGSQRRVVPLDRYPQPQRPTSKTLD